jgi:hypothetical protein
VVPLPVRDENRGKRPARARDHIAECVDVFLDQQRVYENRVGGWKISVDVVGENVRLESPAITFVGLVNTRSSSEDR